MTENWNLQTNLKNKPNAQGTLFSGGKSQMNPTKRYPRGYTPERMRAVQGATLVEGAQMSPNPGWYMSTRHDLLQNLARSTAPVEDMQKFHARVGNLAESAQMVEDGINGSYQRGGSGWGTAEVRLGRVHTPTILHELGHHVSATAGTEHSAYADPEQRGREEGFADSYADKHFVPNPSSKKLMLDDGRRGQGNYPPSEGQAPTREDKLHFRLGYNTLRPHDSRIPTDEQRSRNQTAAIDNKRFRGEINNPTLPGL